MAGERRAVDCRHERHAGLLLQPHERRAPGGLFRREPPPGDGDETASRLQPRQGGADVPPGGVGRAARHMRHDGEGWVHHNDGGADGRVEMIVDLRGVALRDWSRREEPREQARPGRGQLVERQPAAPELGEDGEEPRAGRGLEHEVAGLDVCGRHDRPAEFDRGGELLEGRALLRAPGLRRQHRRELRQERQHPLRRARLADQRRPVTAQEQHGRGFRRLVGELPVPGAAGVGGA